MADTPPNPQTIIHNGIVGPIVREIVEPPLKAGGDAADVLVVAESVVVGVCLAIVKLGGDDKVLDVLIDRARKRLAEIRLKDAETKGQG